MKPFESFRSINIEIENQFKDILNQTLDINNIPQKYFYWSTKYFEENFNFKYNQYDINDDLLDYIKVIGDSIFDNEGISLSVNKDSRVSKLLSITNYNKLFSDSEKNGQEQRYNYILEFVIWKVFETLGEESYNPNFALVSNDLYMEESARKKENIKSCISIQRRNFLATYIKYLTKQNISPFFYLKKTDQYGNKIKYKLYTDTQEGDKLLEELERLNAQGINNSSLEQKINSLYVLQNEVNLHFVFSIESKDNKEELRQLLEIMGLDKGVEKLYRGQANSTWKLDSSLTRNPKFVKNESKMYYDILSLKPDAFVNDNSVYERMITMQHFGMPTRLLDITRNPLIAIFFACNNLQCKNTDGVIFIFTPTYDKFINFEDERMNSLKYIFKDKEMNSIDDEVDNFIDNSWFFRGIAKNQRINNQCGDFIYVGKSSSNNQINSLISKVIIINSNTKKVLLEQLESLNIHGGSVYPDLTHMSNYIKEKKYYDNPNYNSSKSSQKSSFIYENDYSHLGRSIDNNLSQQIPIEVYLANIGNESNHLADTTGNNIFKDIPDTDKTPSTSDQICKMIESLDPDDNGYNIHVFKTLEKYIISDTHLVKYRRLLKLFIEEYNYFHPDNSSSFETLRNSLRRISRHEDLNYSSIMEYANDYMFLGKFNDTQLKQAIKGKGLSFSKRREYIQLISSMLKAIITKYD